jgi:hypothetical protein
MRHLLFFRDKLVFALMRHITRQRRDHRRIFLDGEIVVGEPQGEVSAFQARQHI